MGRAPRSSNSSDQLHKRLWTPREDSLLIKHIHIHGEGRWSSLPKKAGLQRSGKSCRLRWMNYLRPDIKRGNVTLEEEDLIIRMQALLGNRWTLIAGRLPGRTDNEIKNYWNTHICRKLKSQGIHDPTTQKILLSDTLGQEQNMGRNGENNKVNIGHVKRNKKSNSTIEIAKTKIHCPKPIRITSRAPCLVSSSSDRTSVATGGCSRHDGDKELDSGFTAMEARSSDYNISDDNDLGKLIGDFRNDESRFGSDDLECQSQIPSVNSSTLAKLYGEYLQLLNAAI